MDRAGRLPCEVAVTFDHGSEFSIVDIQVVGANNEPLRGQYLLWVAFQSTAGVPLANLSATSLLGLAMAGVSGATSNFVITNDEGRARFMVNQVGASYTANTSYLVYAATLGALTVKEEIFN
jgi:hypothetical protein